MAHSPASSCASLPRTWLPGCVPHRSHWLHALGNSRCGKWPGHDGHACLEHRSCGSVQAAASVKTNNWCVCLAGSNGAHAAGGAQTHVDQTVLTIIAADTVDGLQVLSHCTDAVSRSDQLRHVNCGSLLRVLSSPRGCDMLSRRHSFASQRVSAVPACSPRADWLAIARAYALHVGTGRGGFGWARGAVAAWTGGGPWRAHAGVCYWRSAACHPPPRRGAPDSSFTCCQRLPYARS